MFHLTLPFSSQLYDHPFPLSILISRLIHAFSKLILALLDLCLFLSLSMLISLMLFILQHSHSYNLILRLAYDCPHNYGLNLLKLVRRF